MPRFAFLDDPPPPEAQANGRLKWVFVESIGRPCIRLWRGRSKRPECYSFRSEDQRQAYIDREIEREKSAADFKARRKAERAEHAARLKQSIAIGTILHNSWGYDQTNCDFYQVVAASGAMVTIREIKSEIVPGSEGFMSAKLRPLPNCFVEGAQAMRKRIGPYGVRMEHGTASPCPPDSQHYCSWYA